MENSGKDMVNYLLHISDMIRWDLEIESEVELELKLELELELELDSNSQQLETREMDALR